MCMLAGRYVNLDTHGWCCHSFAKMVLITSCISWVIIGHRHAAKQNAITSTAMTAPLLSMSVQQIELTNTKQARISLGLMTMQITANSWCKADTAVAYLGHVCQLLSELVGLACGSLCTAVCLGTCLLAGPQLFDSHSQCLCNAWAHCLNAALHAHQVTAKPGMCLPGHQQLAPNAGRSVTASLFVAHRVVLDVYASLVRIGAIV
jgi:hypothetical protein